MTQDPTPQSSPRPFVRELAEGEARIPQGADIPLPQSDTPWDEADAHLNLARKAEVWQNVQGFGRSGFGRVALWVFGATFVFVLSIGAWDFITDLLSRNALLGAVGTGLFAAAIVCLLVLAWREWRGYAGLARLDHLREAALELHERPNLAKAKGLSQQLVSLYHGRKDQSWHLAQFEEKHAEVLDGDAVLALAEATLIAPLDAQARAQIEACTRRVALVTAIVPMALADVAIALYANLQMIRRIAEIYGGRSGVLGSWSLMRKVFTSLLATGAVALADDMMSSVAGGGLLSKLSTRLGEGVVNGALSARIGLAAMELCRPLPFKAEPRPSVSSILTTALSGLVPKRRD